MEGHSFVKHTIPYNTNQPQDNQGKTEIYQTRFGKHKTDNNPTYYKGDMYNC